MVDRKVSACFLTAVFALSACGGGSQSSVAEKPTPEYSGAVWYQTPDPDDFLLSTPEVRETAIVGTAQAAATKGPEGLIAEGYPENALASQRIVTSNFRLTFIHNDVEYEVDSFVMGDATVIELTSPGYENLLLIATVGHLFDKGNVNAVMLPEIVNALGPGDVSPIKLDVLQLTVGNVVLDRASFGVVHNYNTDKSGDYVDWGFVLVDKNKVSPEALGELMAGAIPESMISFASSNPNNEYWAICDPENADDKVPMEEGRFVGKFQGVDMVGPWLTAGGCSGAGVFIKDDQGNVMLVGINSGNFAGKPGLNDLVVVQPFANIGKDLFWEAINAAKIDISLQR